MCRKATIEILRSDDRQSDIRSYCTKTAYLDSVLERGARFDVREPVLRRWPRLDGVRLQVDVHRRLLAASSIARAPPVKHGLHERVMRREQAAIFFPADDS